IHPQSNCHSSRTLLRPERFTLGRMRRLNVFNFISMNGYFSGPGDDISWAHMRPEDDLAAESLQGDSVLLFGRRTYELMVQYWPNDAAKKNAPEVAKGMNEAEKIVFS